MKQLILVSLFVFSSLGSYVPVLFGDGNFFDGWSILGGFIGGIVGIWLGVIAGRRWA